MTYSTYDAYCQWCDTVGQKRPTRAWWDAACALPRTNKRISDTQFDIDTERREGWGYAQD